MDPGPEYESRLGNATVRMNGRMVGVAAGPILERGMLVTLDGPAVPAGGRGGRGGGGGAGGGRGDRRGGGGRRGGGAEGCGEGATRGGGRGRPKAAR